MGCSMFRTSGLRDLEPTRNNEAYQLPQTSGDFQRSKILRDCTMRSSCPDCVGQHSCCFLHQQAGWDKVTNFSTSIYGNLGLVYPKGHTTPSGSLGRNRQRRSRHAEQTDVNNPRVGVGQTNSQKPLPFMGLPGHGLVRYPRQQGMRLILFESGYRIRIDRECSHDPLGQHNFLHVPSNPTSDESGVENSSRQCHRDINNLVVAEATLVYHSPSTIQRNVSSAPNNSSIVNTAEQSDQASRFDLVEADSLVHQLNHMTDLIPTTSQAMEDLAQRTVQTAPPSNSTTTASIPTAFDQEIQAILESALRPFTCRSYVAK
ncbi:uncharacterized protein LOC123019264 [Varanus komodoensis]|uniref:uncharacterized protein LOC123019264 n=1 Tax=Varanus komodoensis TaxID=61221 RepID=UPI001CF78F29|nr:uncharacterized protein LOC123019264 [Varanus komodoensis]